jgi:ketosteroid isomerase-like protein
MTAEDEIRELVRKLFRAENHPGDKGAAADVLATDYIPIVRARGQVDRNRDDTLDKIAGASPSFHRHVDRAQIDVHLFPEGQVAIVTSLLPTTDSATKPATEASFRNMHVFLKRSDGWKCVAWQVTRVVQEDKKLPEAFKAYEDGKQRRYSLLFAVNGGAFAIAKLLTGEPGKSGVVLGELTLLQLSLGLVAFTVVMAWDIWEFGEKMRTGYLTDAFGKKGKAVLLLLTTILCLGWLLVGVA